MLQLFAFRRSLRFIALALCSVSIVVIRLSGFGTASPWRRAPRRPITPAIMPSIITPIGIIATQADVALGAQRAANAGRRLRRYQPSYMASSARCRAGGFGSPDVATEARGHRPVQHVARASRWERGVAQMQARGLANANASVATHACTDRHAIDVTPAGGAMASGFGSSNVVAEARRYLGGNPTGRGRLWCARFMNMVLQHSGYRGTGSDMANSFANYGQRVSGPQVGAIAVMSRGRRGGHVGIITGIDASGNPIMISGNNGNRVREAPVSRGRIYAYVMPTS